MSDNSFAYRVIAINDEEFGTIHRLVLAPVEYTPSEISAEDIEHDRNIFAITAGGSIADAIASEFNDDGSCFETADGHQLSETCAALAETSDLSVYERELYVFADGSAILVAGPGWDIAAPCGRCWQGGGCQCEEIFRNATSGVIIDRDGYRVGEAEIEYLPADGNTVACVRVGHSVYRMDEIGVSLDGAEFTVDACGYRVILD